MTLAALFDLAVLVFLKTARAERDAMIKFHARTDFGSLADYDAGPVIDEEMRSNFCARVDIDSGAAVRPFGHDTRYQRDLFVEQVRHSVNGDRFQGGGSRETLSSSTPRRLPQWRDAKEAWQRRPDNLSRRFHCKSVAVRQLHSPLSDPLEEVCDRVPRQSKWKYQGTNSNLKHLGSKFAVANARANLHSRPHGSDSTNDFSGFVAGYAVTAA